LALPKEKIFLLYIISIQGRNNYLAFAVFEGTVYTTL